MIECSRKIDFDAGHRVIGHKNKCQYLHGHRYSLEITATALELDELGMVTDFVVLKKNIKTWIDTNFDHNIILHKNEYYINSNPTDENIALHLWKDVIPLLFAKSSFQILRIRLYETPNCYVEVK